MIHGRDNFVCGMMKFSLNYLVLLFWKHSKKSNYCPSLFHYLYFFIFHVFHHHQFSFPFPHVMTVTRLVAGHVLESILKLLSHERQFAGAPDLGGLLIMVSTSIHTCIDKVLLTGLRAFLSSTERVPALRAMIGGAASGSW